MVKVYLPSLAICTLSLSIDLLVLGICPLPVIAQELTSPTSTKQAVNSLASADVEPEILAEINRVRTNPQGYAHWLEEQKQYYDNIWLRLPGEKPIRAHRLERAIDEAITVLKEQAPLPPLSISEQTSATATKKLEDFAAANQNIQNISYGRKTAKGIVMSLVVDELFPDRRRRKSLLSADAGDTGVVCQNDPRYAKVCAIAYSNSTIDDAAEQQPEETPQAETEIAQQPEVSPSEEVEETAPQETVLEETENPEASSEDAQNDEAVADRLPEPSAPADLPEPNPPNPEAEKPEVEEEVAIAEPEPEDEPEEEVAITEPEPEDEPEEEEVAIAEPEPEDEPEEEVAITEPEPEDEPEEEVAIAEPEPEDEPEEENDEELEEVEKEIEEVEQELAEIEQEIEEEDNEEEPEEEIFEAEESEDTEEQVATNSDSSRLLENVERGILEEGDRVIEEDGSFYDSYPLEAQSGESFTIALESEEFDAFVALIDSQGNIIEQNDDINEEDSNSRITVTIPENGVYNVIVNAYDEGGMGQYVLTVNR